MVEGGGWWVEGLEFSELITLPLSFGRVINKGLFLPFGGTYGLRGVHIDNSLFLSLSLFLFLSHTHTYSLSPSLSPSLSLSLARHNANGHSRWATTIAWARALW